MTTMALSFMLMMILETVLAQWDPPYLAHNGSLTISMKDVYLDPSTSTLHILWCGSRPSTINYWQVDKHYKVQPYEISAEEYGASVFFTGRIVGKGDGESLYMLLMGKRAIEGVDYYDLWFTEYLKTPKRWSDPIRVPRDNMDDTCDRYSDSLLVIRETGRVFIFYHVECASSAARTAYVTRQTGGSFSKERFITSTSETSQYRPSVTAVYTMKRVMGSDRPVVHLFWADRGTSSRPVRYRSSEDNGASWSKPTTISDDDLYAGFFSLAVTANSQVGNDIVGTYATMRPKPLRLFFSKDQGAHFDVRVGTTYPQGVLSWEYRTNSMCICGAKSAPTLFMLSQEKNDYAEFSIWNLNDMSVQRPGGPFGEHRMGGAMLVCQDSGNGKIAVTAVGAVAYGEREVHILISRYRYPEGSGVCSRRSFF